MFKAQLSEREQERDEYEAKITELRELAHRKSTNVVENEESTIQKVFSLLLFLFTHYLI